MKISPSLLAADFKVLGAEVKKIADAGAEMLHLDVMDGHFVPNMSFGPDVIKAIRPVSDIFFDVHLMIEKPERFVDKFIAKEHVSIASPIKNDENMFILRDVYGYENIWQVCGKISDYTGFIIPHLYRVRKIGIMFD